MKMKTVQDALSTPPRCSLRRRGLPEKKNAMHPHRAGDFGRRRNRRGIAQRSDEAALVGPDVTGLDRNTSVRLNSRGTTATRIGSIVIHCVEFDRMLAFWQEALHDALSERDSITSILLAGLRICRTQAA